MPSRIFIILIAVFLISCSVLEDRRDCPCYLTVVSAPGARYPENGSFSIFGYGNSQNGDVIRKEGLKWSGLDDTRAAFPVPKGSYEMLFMEGYADYVRKDGILSQHADRQADSLYASVSHLECYSDEAELPLRRYKQFATVTVKVRSDGSSVRTLQAYGNYGAMSLPDLRPVESGYSFQVNSVDGLFVFRMLRQPWDAPWKLYLDTVSESGITSLQKVDLAYIFSQTSFDWKAESLDDIFIDIDYLKMRISVSIHDWDGDCNLEIFL